jgi:PST family polysaccharide transporter
MSKGSNFSSIFKSTFLFGGSQVIVLLTSLIRNKFAAIFLGAAGLGLNGIFVSTLNLIKAFTTFGINESAVKDIAKANGSGDKEKVVNIYSVYRFWVFLTGLFGIIVLLFFAPYISFFAFKNEEKAFDFQLLSLTIFFVALSAGINTYLRGIQKIQTLSVSNAIGAIIGLFFTIPLYYYFGINGIVPSLILTSLVFFIISVYNKIRFKIVSNELPLKELITSGGPMLKLGISLSTVTILASAVNFVLNTYILKVGGLHDVGLFGIGNSIIDAFVGIVFTSIAADFFPRLSSMIEDEEAWKKLINEQLELALLLLTLGLVVMVNTAPFLVRLLLSEDLLESTKFIYAAILYVPFKVVVWVSGFLLVAKGDNRLFVIIETIGSILLLLVSVSFYQLLGLPGLGYALVFYFVFYFIFIYFLMKRRYKLNFSKGVNFCFLYSVFSIAICLILKTQLNYPYSLIFELIFSFFTIGFSIWQLNRRIDLIEIFSSRFRK